MVRVRQPRRPIAAGVTQLCYLVGGAALGMLTPLLTAGPMVISTDIRGLLFAIGGGVIALISVIYSLLFLVVQWASTAFSPRLALFRDDPIVWHSSGFFVGMFAYCTVAALRMGDAPTISVLVPGIALIMAVASLVVIRRLQLRAFRSIQLSAVLSELDQRGRAVLDRIYQAPLTARDVRTSGAAPDANWSTERPARALRWKERPGVLQRMDLDRLVELAGATDSVIALDVGVGDTVQEGAVLATVAGEDNGVIDANAVISCIVIGIERTFDQDPRLAFRLLVDIAMRAQSAAINDQATTIQCLDVLEGLLRHLANRDLDIGHIHGPDGRLRVVLAVPTWTDYVSASVDDLTLAAVQSPTVLARIRTMLVDLDVVAPPGHREALGRRVQLVAARLQRQTPSA